MGCSTLHEYGEISIHIVYIYKHLFMSLDYLILSQYAGLWGQKKIKKDQWKTTCPVGCQTCVIPISTLGMIFILNDFHVYSMGLKPRIIHYQLGKIEHIHVKLGFPVLFQLYIIIYIYAYIYIYIYIYVYVYAYIYKHVNIYTIYIYIYIHIYIYTHAYIYTYIYIYICVFSTSYDVQMPQFWLVRSLN